MCVRFFEVNLFLFWKQGEEKCEFLLNLGFSIFPFPFSGNFWPIFHFPFFSISGKCPSILFNRSKRFFLSDCSFFMISNRCLRIAEIIFWHFNPSSLNLLHSVCNHYSFWKKSPWTIKNFATKSLTSYSSPFSSLAS